MIIRRVSEKYGYIAVLFALSFVCAIPLIHAHSVQTSWSDERDTSGWAWVGHPTYTVENGDFNTRSEHQLGILNKTGGKININVGYDHKIFRNGSHINDDDYTATLQVKPKNEGEDVYFTTSDVPGHYVRSASTPVPGEDDDAEYTLGVYTKLTYLGRAQAKAPHRTVDLIP